jgi:hypothetical protein
MKRDPALKEKFNIAAGKIADRIIKEYSALDDYVVTVNAIEEQFKDNE